MNAKGNNNPGRLDRLCTLSYGVEARDSVGGVEVTWTEADDVWAAKMPVGGGRLYAAESKLYEQSLTYRIRHRTDVRPGWRLTHGDDVYEITAVAELGRRHFLDLELRGLGQSPGDAGTGELLHDGSTVLLHDGSSQLLHAA